MRFVGMVRVNRDSKSGAMPGAQRLAEAIGCVKRCPNPFDGESEIEIGQVFEPEDFGEVLLPELRAQEQRLRSES